MPRIALTLVLAATIAPGWIGDERAAAAGVEVPPENLAAFQPLPDTMEPPDSPATEAKINLGRMLYYDTRLSKGQDVSCNTCHRLDQYGVDGLPTSVGHRGLRGTRNAPTVYNAAGHVAQFWDGRARDVEEQAKGPVLNPIEMGMASDKEVVAILKGIPGYVQAFREAFPGEADPVTFENMAAAIGAFERRLVTPSRWDAFLRGDRNALTDEEKAGFNTFVEAGCATCHNGPYLGGTMYMRLGVVRPWPDTSDPGRFAVTKQEADMLVFKVPSLRNIERTGPFFHDGSITRLDRAVRIMAEYQLGKNLTEAEVASIVAWLRSLTGTIPAEYIKPPVLPQ